MANRCGREGMFLKSSEREILLERVATFEKRRSQSNTETSPSKDSPDERWLAGCRVCKKDNNHSDMLLCERCNAEYHFYCVGLDNVPSEDWFCDVCKSNTEIRWDGLELRVAAMPPVFTSRFGEIVWAQGGPGYGWWPSYIYDPRMTVGGARDLARKHLGKKHLVYFFQCLEAPFAALPDSKLTEWYAGLTESYHLGKSAKNNSKNRAVQFAEAFKIAILELGKPIELRMDWNHPEPRDINPHDFQSEQSSDGGKQTDALSSATKKRKRNRNSANKIPEEVSPDVPFIKPKPSVRINLEAALKAHNSAIVDEDDELYLRILHGHPPVNIGFVKFGSRMSSTFHDARQAIHRDLDCFEDTNDVISDAASSKTSIRTKLPSSWRFHVPELGPISFKQEMTLGPMLLFLQSASSDLQLGDGTIRRPVKVLIIREDDICKLVD